MSLSSVDRNAAILVEKNKKAPPYWQYKPKFSERGQSYVVIKKLKQEVPDENLKVDEGLILEDIYYEKYAERNPADFSTGYYYDIYYKYKIMKNSQ